MKKTSLIKGILVILLSVVLMGTTGVYAASSDEDIDDFLMNFSSSNTTTSNNSSSDSNTDSGNTTVANNTTSNSNTSKSNTNTSKSNTNSSSSNSSVYNNTNSSNLPKTGIEDSLPTMVLVVVFAISAIYAFKKIKEYNI